MKFNMADTKLSIYYIFKIQDVNKFQTVPPIEDIGTVTNYSLSILYNMIGPTEQTMC